MAKNKREVDPQLKRSEIEAAALRLFIEHGYEDTSMAKVAAEAGIAPNTLYWYYENKDDLLIAALDHHTKAIFEQYARHSARPLAEQISWALEQFESASKLVSTVHVRLSQSARIKSWHDGFHQLLEGLLIAQLRQRGESAERAALIATVGTFVVEGLLVHPHSTEQRTSVVAWLAALAEGGRS